MASLFNIEWADDMWSDADEWTFQSEKETREREWAEFIANGTVPKGFKTKEDYEGASVEVRDECVKRWLGVPPIYEIHDDGRVTILTGEAGLFRVVIQPANEIAMELATPMAAREFVNRFKKLYPDGKTWAEIIDYEEARLRARAEGY